MCMKKLSNVEYEFMDFVWNNEKELCYQDFKENFASKDWKDKTISTFLHQITKKGYLDATRRGRVFYYLPKITRLEYQQHIINQTLKSTYGVPIENVIASFCGKEPTSKESIDEIKNWLKELEDKSE